MRRRVSTGQLAGAAIVLITVTWLVAANFIRVEVRVFGAEWSARLGWALAAAIAIGIAIGVAFTHQRRR